MYFQRLMLVVIAAGICSSTIFGGLRTPGKYCGVVVFDRWDGCTLYSGIYVMYIAESVKPSLREDAGQCVQINAKKVRQIINPGDGVISEFVKLGAAPVDQAGVLLDGLCLHTEPAFIDGEHPIIRIAIRNTGKEEVKVIASELAPTLLAKSAGGKNSFESSNGRSFAIVTRQGFRIGPHHEPRTSSRGVTNGGSYAWTIDAAVPDSFVLKPGGEHTVTIRFELSAGEYDFLAGYGGGVHAGECLASNLTAFDVDSDGNATAVKVQRK